MTGSLINQANIEANTYTRQGVPLIVTGSEHFIVRHSTIGDNPENRGLGVEWGVGAPGGGGAVSVTFPVAIPFVSCLLSTPVVGGVGAEDIRTSWTVSVDEYTFVIERRSHNANFVVLGDFGFFWNATGSTTVSSLAAAEEPAPAFELATPTPLVSYWADAEKKWIFCVVPEGIDAQIPVTVPGDYTSVVTHTDPGIAAGILAFSEPRSMDVLQEETNPPALTSSWTAEERLARTGWTLARLRAL